jgi:hypothetical protein
MGASITTEDGFTLTVHHTMYLDYGLSISKDGKELFYNPCCLSVDSYGRKPKGDLDWDEAEATDAFDLWDEVDWVECLKNEADTLIEGFIPDAC